METAKLKKFAQFARRSLIEQVSAKLKLVLAENSAARRERAEAIKKLEEAIKGHGKELVVERVAYIWFNRFCALRFMDVNRYNRINIVSPADPGQFQPEILAEAKMGHIDEEMVHDKVRQQIFALLDGKAPSRDPQGEAYRLLVVAACNFFHRAMPFLFQRIDDYTELLMPDDLLSGNSILAYTREAMTPDACGVESEKWEVGSKNQSSHSSLSTSHSAAEGGVEVIGWLYQFYISEKKDEVFDDLKKNKKITPENIPAATQLFTPHWIVKYLVENSLGRLWMLNRPNSRLVDWMEYYIRPDTSVGREKWEVESKEKPDGSAELSRIVRLAESDGFGGVGLPGNQSVSKGGTVRTDESNKASSRLDSIQHSGRPSSTIDSGVQKLSIDSTGIKSGSGNTDHDRSAPKLLVEATGGSNSGAFRGNQTNDVLINREVGLTSHSSLPTSHSASTHEEDFLRINKPEDIKICDPACGSGHMLTYAFDLLYAIYEEEGYESAEIPEKILTHNLFGLEIDERAGELAAFALTMKARSRSRRFFRKSVKPNICVLQNVVFENAELTAVGSEKWIVGSEKQKAMLHDLHLFKEADNFGSLLRPQLPLEDIESLQKTVHSTLSTSHLLFDSMTHQKVLQALRQADYLSPKYHVVIANPPYMGGKGMNGRLAAWVKDNYSNSKSDLFAMFIERNLDLAQKHGAVAMITMQSWMFLTSFEALRLRLLSQNTLLSMAHLGTRAFDSIGGEVVSTTAFVVSNSSNPEHKGAFLRLVSRRSEAEKSKALIEGIKDPRCGWFHRVKANDLSKIPGYPIAYWANENAFSAFARDKPISSITSLHRGISTGNNELFARLWHEVSYGLFSSEATNSQEAKCSSARWFPYNRGGTFRKWYGLGIDVIDYENGGHRMIAAAERGDSPGFRHDGSSEYFNETITWTALTAGKPSFRFLNSGYVLGHKGSSIKSPVKDRLPLLGLFNSNVLERFLEYLSPTLDINIAQISALPLPVHFDSSRTGQVASELVDASKKDWDSFETSWDFTSLPLLNPDYRQPTLKATYQKLRAHWREMTLEMQRLEEENNRIFIEAYGLQDELSPEVPLNEITLTCNPHYRYGVEECEVGSEKWEEIEARLLQDTMKELVSYAVGCMFGRYSLDIPGLVLANQGESIADYYRKIEEYRANECEELSGTDRLAEGHGSGGDDLSSDSTIPEGGVVRPDESGSQGGSVDSPKPSGGAGEAINSGVQKLSVDSTGFQSGSRNPTDDRSTAELTSHSPLPTSHFSSVPDDDNVIPMLDGDWFTDDIAERFRKFLRVAFGEENYEENILFVEKALNIKGKRNYSIRNYFLGEFYNDHWKRYKKRPVYWLFSSPKGSFNALIYMHRYRPDTVSVVLNDYLREFRIKLTSHKNHLEAVSISGSNSQGEKTKALKETLKITKMIAELEEYEREVLYPLATEQVEIDLDDGVKVNYPKLGAALKKIPGLEVKED